MPRKKTKIELFEELAGIDENGCSRWVSVTDRLLHKLNNKKAFESHLQAFILQNVKSLNLLELPK